MITLKPHHLLCIPRYYRGGYNNKYAKNFKRICMGIRKNPDQKIKVTKKCDDICIKCPHQLNYTCKKRENINHWIMIMDNKVLKLLKIKNNSTHKAKDILNLSINKIKKKELKNICKGCEFLQFCIKYNLNKSFIKDINKI
jgi:hypothetical protein